jgi:hypothetical protein
MDSQPMNNSDQCFLYLFLEAFDHVLFGFMNAINNYIEFSTHAFAWK